MVNFIWEPPQARLSFHFFWPYAIIQALGPEQLLLSKFLTLFKSSSGGYFPDINEGVFMKKLMLIVVLVASAQSFALQAIGATEVLATVAATGLGLTLTTYSNQHDKELMVAASDDAIAFLQAEGQGPKSVLLQAAFRQFSADPQLATLSEVEKAEAVVYLASQQ